jgi:hypothetical protein
MIIKRKGKKCKGLRLAPWVGKVSDAEIQINPSWQQLDFTHWWNNPVDLRWMPQYKVSQKQKV